MCALSHKETDKIPIDMGSTHASSIHIRAYRALLELLGYNPADARVKNIIGQLALVEGPVMDTLGIYTAGIWNEIIPKHPPQTINGERSFEDDIGVTWKMPANGYYYDMVGHPLKNTGIEDIEKFRWPDPADKRRFESQDMLLDHAVRSGRATVFGCTLYNGVFQTGNMLEGYEDFMCDILADSPKAELLLDKILDMKIRFWDAAIDRWSEKLDIVAEQDDLGTQLGLLISPELYRSLIKPRHKILFAHIKRRLPGAKLFFHSCGSVRALIDDFIDAGIDILNPIQISAAGMTPKEIKSSYGKDITLWGGGVDTQNTLASAAPSKVADEVKRNIEIFAPGGGYVFSAVHNIQADVPARNIIAMFDAVLKYGVS